MRAQAQPPGFTLFEILIAVSIGITLFSLVLAVYTLTIQSFTSGQNTDELTQSSRSVIERLTRDIREARMVTTTLPPSNNDPNNPPPQEINMEDGHSDILQYIRYYMDGTDLRRQVLQYSFPSAPGVLVPYNAADDFENPPDSTTVSDTLTSEFVIAIAFYGENPITIELTMKKGSVTQAARTALYGRNL